MLFGVVLFMLWEITAMAVVYQQELRTFKLNLKNTDGSKDRHPAPDGKQGQSDFGIVQRQSYHLR